MAVCHPMTSKLKKPVITPEMAMQGFRHCVSEAGLDWDHDWFTPPHVVREIFDKGFECGLAEAKRIAEKRKEAAE